MESEDDFEGWLMFMDDAIQQLLDELPKDVSQQLDFTPESLLILERWLLSRYASIKAILQPSENWILDRVARYVGETIRRAAGGNWCIELNNPSHVYYRLPEVKKESAWGECPASLVTAALDRRRGNYMKMIVQNMAQEGR